MYESQGDIESAATIAYAAGLLSDVNVPASSPSNASYNGLTPSMQAKGFNMPPRPDNAMEGISAAQVAAYRGRYRCGRCGLLKVRE